MKTTRWLFGAVLALGACSDGSPVGPDPRITACSPGDGGTLLSLATGEVRILSGAAVLSCIQLPASGPSDYIFVAANADSITDREQRYLVQSSTSTSTASASVEASVASQGETSIGAADLSLSLTPVTFEAALREKERRTLDLSQARAAREARRSTLGSPGVSLSLASANVNVGDGRQFRVPDANATNLCQNYVNVGARARAVGTQVVIWQDTLAPANGFTDADFAAIAKEFDDLIHPTDVRYFGLPSDIDANGKVFILYTPEVNKLTKRGSVGFVGGFFFGGDLFPRYDTDGSPICEQSNEAELFYMLVPDPDGVFSDARSTARVRQATRGTVSHEFQHMINAGLRLANPAAEEFEVAWLNEALSHLAEELVGRAKRGYGDMQHLTFSDIYDVSNNLQDFEAFFFQNLARFETWLEAPDTSAATSSRARDQLAPRGAAWALLRYAADHFSGNNVADFTRRLTAGPQVSVANFVQQSKVPFDTIIAGWMVANYADDAGIAGVNQRFSYRSWHLRSVQSGINQGVFPLRVRTLRSSGTDSISTKARSASGNYFRMLNTSSTPAFSFRFVGIDGKPVTFSAARLYVLRAR